MDQGEIIIYKAFDNANFQIEVCVEDDTVWLNRHQIATLFNRDIKTIGKHIANALQEELLSLSVVAKFGTTASDAKEFKVDMYFPDKINSIGYSVKNECYDLLYN